jgi:DNA replication and repair protein RecF
MSELDPERRARLAAELGTSGQALITTTDLDHVPGAREPGITRLAVSEGTVLQEALAA